MNRWKLSVLLFGLAFVLLPGPVSAASMPGSVLGQALNFTISEPAEGATEPVNEPVMNFTFNVGANNFVESGTLLLCEPGTTCDPADNTKTNWSDVIQWFGGNCDQTGLCTGSLYSDPTAFPDLTFPVGQGTIVMAEVLFPNGGDGVVYQANDGSGNITTWTINSDVPAVPEPASVLLLGSGIVALLGCNRLVKKKRA